MMQCAALQKIFNLFQKQCSCMVLSSTGPNNVKLVYFQSLSVLLQKNGETSIFDGFLESLHSSDFCILAFLVSYDGVEVAERKWSK